MFLLFLLASTSHARLDPFNEANQLLILYGHALKTTSISKLNAVLDVNYELYPCDKTVQPLNREKIVETVEQMPQKTIKLSKRKVTYAEFSNDRQLIRLNVSLGSYTTSRIEAKSKNNRWVIHFEQQDNCEDMHDLATTYMIDYNETAYHTGRVLLDTLVGWSRREKKKWIVDVMNFPFHLSYYQKDAMDTSKTLHLTEHNLYTYRGFHSGEIEKSVVRIMDAVLWQNRSLTFITYDLEHRHQSFFIADPFKGDEDETSYRLTHQFIQEPLEDDLDSLNFQQLQNWSVEKGDEGGEI